MHPDIEKLIHIARECGNVTDKQREIILRKARALGDDLDEVEMVLETITNQSKAGPATDIHTKKMKCPNCGATIFDTSFVCPECGSVLQQENKASIEARAMIERLQERLADASKPASKSEMLLRPNAHIERQVSTVNTFTMPTTKEGLTQFLEFAYSNYISIGNGVDDLAFKSLKDAWYGKTMQAYNSLERLGGSDPGIKVLLNNYSSLISQEKKKIGGLPKLWIWAIIAMIAMGGIIHLGVKSDNAAKDQIETCLQNHDYQGAKAAAKYQKDIDMISAREVTYLISQGEIQQAKVVAASISDPEMRESVLSSIIGFE